MQDEEPRGKLGCMLLGHDMAEHEEWESLDQQTCERCGCQYFPDTDKWATPQKAETLDTKGGKSY